MSDDSTTSDDVEVAVVQLDGDDVVFYMPALPPAWIQTDTTVDLDDAH